jgi:hypothetical protein
LLSQDAARCPLVPTFHAPLGVTGQRPMVGTWENQALVSCFAALTLVTGPLTTRVLEPPAPSKAKTGHSQQPRRQTACGAHLQDMARAYPARGFPAVVSTIDNAPGPRGAGVEDVLAASPHLRLSR